MKAAALKMKEKELIEIEEDEKIDKTIQEEDTEEQSENETKISDVDFDFN